MKKKHRELLLWGIVLLSFLGLFLSPKDRLIEQIKTTIPWVATGIIFSEIILTFGFLLMLSVATPTFIRKMTKGLKEAARGIIGIKETIREFDWNHVANKCNDSKLFWAGFWLTVVGACGDGVVLIVGIGKALPIASWGLMILPFWDLSLTYIIRRAIHKSVKKSASAPRNS
jgi:hypothetical protein